MKYNQSYIQLSGNSYKVTRYSNPPLKLIEHNKNKLFIALSIILACIALYLIFQPGVVKVCSGQFEGDLNAKCINLIQQND